MLYPPKILSTNDFRKCMEISLEDLYVGLKGSKDTIYNFSRQSSLKDAT